MTRSAPSDPLRVGVVGTGALGRHHVRILSQLREAELVGMFDQRSEVTEELAQKYAAKSCSSMEELAERAEAVVLAVPTVDHAELGCELLSRGLHVLVEKPIASSVEEADRLLAAVGERVLAVGHVEFYNPAVQALLSARPKPRYVEVQRLGEFTTRSLDIDVILDLMIHDLQILHALDGSRVEEVRAIGIDVLSPRIDIANARVQLASGCVANLTASRVSSERVRRLRVFSPSRYFSVDYQEQSIKGIRLEGNGGDQATGPRRIAPEAVRVEKREPLQRELECFVAACRGEAVPLVDGAQGRQALETALSVVEAVAS